jgi:LemA protein
MGAIVFLVIVLAAMLGAVSLYNQLVSLRNRCQNAYSQIDVQLKRRYDLIPNLVETAKGYMAHERGTLEAVIAARNNALASSKQVTASLGDEAAMKGLITAETALTGTLGKFMALSEAYPDLKANQNMSQLMEELSSTENKIAFARQSYNDSVMSYNIARESFPSNIFAQAFAFKPRFMFQIEEEHERKAIEVKF